MRRPFRLAAGLLPLLIACQPALNWRDARFQGAGLVALLPCKPDRGTRTVPLGGRDTALEMQGCDADGATFAIAHARAADPAQAGSALAHWRAATLNHLQAQAARESSFAPAGALALPQTVRVTATGRRPDGRPVQMQAVWFAHAEPDGVHLFHAAVYAERLPAQTADAFFGGLRFPS